jgi:hypothetical protein
MAKQLDYRGCLQCGEQGEHEAKGLCRKCYYAWYNKSKRKPRKRWRPYRDRNLAKIAATEPVRYKKFGYGRGLGLSYMPKEIRMVNSIVKLMRYVPADRIEFILNAPFEPRKKQVHQGYHHVPKIARGICKTCYKRWLYWNNPDWRMKELLKQKECYHKRKAEGRIAPREYKGLHQRRADYAYACRSMVRRLSPEGYTMLRSKIKRKARLGSLAMGKDEAPKAAG